MDFIADRNIAVKGILRIRVCSQCADKKRAVRKLRLHRVFIVVVDDLYTAAMLLVLAHEPDIVIQKIKALKGLHQSCGRYVGFGAAAPVPQGQCPSKGSGKARFNVFPRYKNKGLVKPHHISAFQLKP